MCRTINCSFYVEKIQALTGFNEKKQDILREKIVKQWEFLTIFFFIRWSVKIKVLISEVPETEQI